MLEVTHGPELRHDLREQVLPPLEWQAAEVEVFVRQEIESVERRRQLDGHALDVDRRMQRAALLQQREPRPPLLVADDDLAVDDELLRRKGLDRARDLREDPGVVVPLPRQEPDVVARLARDQPIAVELELEEPP